MVFSSAPLYLDPPNWQQQLHGNGSERNGINISNNNNNHHHLIPPPPPTIPQPPPHHHQVGRPTPTAERARLEKIPPPETPLKCPRCDSTNTKFCYYNNYNLNQPRHFCKTCRRYWTRGGALRNVPVGGGYRKNKRSSGGNKSSSTSTSTSTASASATAKSSSSLSLAGPAGGSFMASLQSIAQLGGGMGSHLAGLGFGGGGPLPLLHNNVNPLDQFDHYGISNTMLSQHHHQMAGGFPNFLGGFGGGSSTSSFQNVVVGGDDVGKVVKMENGLNIEKGILMGISTSPTAGNNNNNNNNQFWGNINNNNNNNNIWSGTGNHEL